MSNMMTQQQSMDNIEKIDSAFEFFILLTTILQAVLYQLITFMLDKTEELNLAVGFALVFTVPFIVALFAWIRVVIEDVTERTIKLRIIAWASTEAGLFFNIILLLVMGLFRIVVISVNLAVVFLIVGLFSYFLYSSSLNIILEGYRRSTDQFQIWNNGGGTGIALFTWLILLSLLTGILRFWS